MDTAVLLICSRSCSRCWRLAFLRAAPKVRLHVVQNAAESYVYLSSIDVDADGASNLMPRLILVDLDVARRTALEVLAWLKSQPGLMQIPVFVLTSAGESGDVDQAYALGASSCLRRSMTQKAARELAKGIEAYAALLTPGFPPAAATA